MHSGCNFRSFQLCRVHRLCVLQTLLNFYSRPSPPANRVFDNRPDGNTPQGTVFLWNIVKTHLQPRREGGRWNDTLTTYYRSGDRRRTLDELITTYIYLLQYIYICDYRTRARDRLIDNDLRPGKLYYPPVVVTVGRYRSRDRVCRVAPGKRGRASYGFRI